MPAVSEENTVVIEGVSWEAYLQMDELLEESSVRMKWSDDRLEITSPISRHHELIKSNVSRMIELFCRRKGIFFLITGSATMRKERRRGGEPDDSYIFTRVRRRPTS
jgi:Uma2 family endonuclease